MDLSLNQLRMFMENAAHVVSIEQNSKHLDIFLLSVDSMSKTVIFFRNKDRFESNPIIAMNSI